MRLLGRPRSATIVQRVALPLSTISGRRLWPMRTLKDLARNLCDWADTIVDVEAWQIKRCERRCIPCRCGKQKPPRTAWFAFAETLLDEICRSVQDTDCDLSLRDCVAELTEIITRFND